MQVGCSVNCSFHLILQALDYSYITGDGDLCAWRSAAWLGCSTVEHLQTKFRHQGRVRAVAAEGLGTVLHIFIVWRRGIHGIGRSNNTTNVPRLNKRYQFRHFHLQFHVTIELGIFTFFFSTNNVFQII
jgi:hypothetical protein